MKRLVPLLLLAAACSRTTHEAEVPEPTPQPRSTRQYVGHYEAGWEVQRFRPCQSPESWWTWSTGLIQRDPPGAPGRYFVVLEGEVSAPGRYGHLGAYPRQIVITRVLEARPAGEDDCADPRRA